MSSKEHKEKIWSIISKIHVGMLTTQSIDGVLRARPMELVQTSYDNKIWFFANASSEKTKDLYEDGHANLTFSDPQDSIYVSLSGHASVVRDEDMIDKLWNKNVAQWYENGRSDPAVVLIEMRVFHGEHWNPKLHPIKFSMEQMESFFHEDFEERLENQRF